MTRVDTVFTIGVYGHSQQSFLEALGRHKVDLVVDVRQRRAVRGSKYSFANASRLDRALLANGIKVVSWKDLAPSRELREVQRAADSDSTSTKATRSELSTAFVAGFQRDVLATHDPREVLRRMAGYRRPAFLCVERLAHACHRSLVAGWLATHAGVEVIDLEV